MQKTKFTTDDLMKFKFVSDPVLSVDGKLAAYVLATSEKEKYLNNIFVYDFAEKASRQFTFGNSDKYPRFSPDGKVLAFLSGRKGKNQLYTISLDGGEAQPLVQFRYGVNDIKFSPCGKRIAFTAGSLAGQTVEDLKKLEEDERDKELKETYDTARRITKIRYKSNGLPGAGLIGDRNNHIYVVDLETKEVKQLTDGTRNESIQSWHPNGKSLVFMANWEADEDENPRIRDLYSVDVATGKTKKLTSSNGSYSLANFSPDGKYLAFYGNQLEYDSATNNTLYLMNMSSGSVRDLLSGFDQAVGIYAALDMNFGSSYEGPVFSNCGEYVYFTSSHHGQTHFYRVSRKGKDQERLTKGFLQINHYHIHDGKAVIIHSTPSNPGDLAFVNLADGKVKDLTAVNAEFLAGKEVSEVEEFWFDSFDGTPIQGWLQKPAGFVKGEKYPLIINVHGGPHSVFTSSFFFEFHLLNSEGYVMLYINPRGSIGYGQAFTDAVRGHYGEGDYFDIMAAVDYATSLPYVDKDNLGITGGSYGGFMTNWVVGHTNRFKAAVTLRSISNWVSFYGVSDIGVSFAESEIGVTPWGNIAKMWDHSPLKYVENVNTPLLIIHAEEDIRCPMEQAEQFYIFLRRLGRKTELLRFPRENHELSRSGMPKRRLARLNAIVDWFNAHLERNNNSK